MDVLCKVPWYGDFCGKCSHCYSCFIWSNFEAFKYLIYKIKHRFPVVTWVERCRRLILANASRSIDKDSQVHWNVTHWKWKWLWFLQYHFYPETMRKSLLKVIYNQLKSISLIKSYDTNIYSWWGHTLHVTIAVTYKMHAIGLFASLLPLPYIFSNHYSGRMEKIPRTYLWPTPKANLEIVDTYSNFVPLNDSQ